MAGTIVTGMSPATVAFAEETQTMTIDDTAAVAAESEESEETAAEPAEDTTEAPADTTADEPAADIPADTPAAEPTQEPADTPAAEDTAEISDDGFGSGDTEEMTDTETEIAVQAEENSNGKIYIQAEDGTQTEYASLEEAIASAPVDIGKDGTLTQILITGSIEISKPVVIDQNKNISIAAAEDNTTITRASGFKGDMFQVTGENTSFQFGTGKNGDTVLNLTVNGAPDEGDAEGSIVKMASGYFGINDGVTLTGNRTNAAGSAIYNDG